MFSGQPLSAFGTALISGSVILRNTIRDDIIGIKRLEG